MKQENKNAFLQKREHFARCMQIPMEFARGNIFVSLLGQREAYIENYSCILEYTSECLKLQSRTGMVSVLGKQLQIVYYNDTDMWIQGYIKAVLYGGGTISEA